MKYAHLSCIIRLLFFLMFLKNVHVIEKITSLFISRLFVDTSSLHHIIPKYQ